MILKGVVQSIEAFTCLMYSYPNFVSINLVHTTVLKKMVGINEGLTSKSKMDLSQLPTCKDCLIPHFQCVNHRLAIFEQAILPMHWSPKLDELGQRWQKVNNVLEPVWSCEAVFPRSLVDIMDDIQQENEEEIIQNFEENDFDDEQIYRF